MPVREAEAIWEGDLKSGHGAMKLGSSVFEGHYSYETRFADSPGTNPEELIGAALAGCFSMAFSKVLEDAGYEPRRILTMARVHLDRSNGGFAITRINLTTEVETPLIEHREFERLANLAKENCPVSQILQGVNVELDAMLVT